VPIPPALRDRWRNVFERIERPVFGEPVGCPTCRNKGYKGRLGVYELLPVNDAVSNKILEGVPPTELAAVGKEFGYVPMFEAGMEHVFSGETSYEELVRVVTNDS
jgi:general secretion pathway protein E